MAKVKGEHDSRIGATVLECTELAALSVRRPIERGYLVNAPQQRDIWMHTLTQVMPPPGTLNHAICPFKSNCSPANSSWALGWRFVSLTSGSKFGDKAGGPVI